MKTALITACALASIGLAQADDAKNADALPAEAKNGCATIVHIQNWRVLDSRNVVLFVPNAKRAYLMHLSSPISDLKFAGGVAFLDNDRDGRLCARSPDRIIASDSIVRQPTLIGSITHLDDAGFAALEAKYEVKLRRREKDDAKDEVAKSGDSAEE
jgi:hypothetical protein